jgi:signal transduction histidine kinase/CheY-like chemotaxis protein
MTDHRPTYEELTARVAALEQAHAAALERERATAHILQAISRSAFDLQPVLDTLVEQAARLCDALAAFVLERQGDVYRVVAYRGLGPEHEGYIRELSFREGDESIVARIGEDAQVRHLVTQRPGGAPQRLMHIERDTVERFGIRAFLGVPLVTDGAVVGVLSLWRTEPHAFSEHQVELVRTFADQAVIAMENARLVRELQERNRELGEALEQQTAVAGVLQAISRSTFDLQGVLDTLVENAARLIGNGFSVLTRRWDDHLRIGAVYAIDGEERAAIESGPLAWLPVDHPHDLHAVVVREGRPRAFINRPGDPRLERLPVEYRDFFRRFGTVATLIAPLRAGEQVIGTLEVARHDDRRFTDREVGLLQTFADQAVIAIENARLFEELQQKTIELGAASRHKSEFLANMSHELRTPLNAIIGFSEVLVERMFGDLNEKQEEYLADILASGKHLLALINDILDISKVEAGRMELDLSTFSLREALEHSLAMFRERAARHGVTLGLDLDPRLDVIEADERKVKQILFNLLSNAEKFTKPGGRVDLRARPTDEGLVEVSVRDTGIGIAPEDQEQIFEEFHQAGAAADHAHEGTGLGLALTRKFVELHGGSIRVESAPGEGSTFTFTIPARPSTPEPAAPVEPSALPGAFPTDGHDQTVLLVEDDPRSIDLFTLYLESEGFRVQVARDGATGLEMARRLRPTAIALDILLPGIDGWDFLTQAKADPDLRDIPVIVVSMLDERGKGFALGAADYLVKPVSRDALLGALHRAVPAGPRTNGPIKVLAVDDDPIATELVEALLTPEGYTVLKANSGAEGVALAQRERPALVVLDLLMPELDGFAVVERLRDDPATASIPIIILTSKSMTAAEKKRLNGRIDYLARKGEFDRATFIEVVRNVSSGGLHHRDTETQRLESGR